jgi:hypothetical protein
MHKELASRLVNKVQEGVPKVVLTAEEIAQITMITLSTLADFVRKHSAFGSARLFDYARESVKRHLEEEGST